MKPVKFVGSSRSDIRAFSDDVRQDAGAQLRRVQNGWSQKIGSRCRQSDLA